MKTLKNIVNRRSVQLLLLVSISLLATGCALKTETVDIQFTVNSKYTSASSEKVYGIITTMGMDGKMGVGVAPTDSKEAEKYYMVVTDGEGKKSCFNIHEGLYFLIDEGDTITLQYHRLTQDNGKIYKGTYKYEGKQVMLLEDDGSVSK